MFAPSSDQRPWLFDPGWLFVIAGVAMCAAWVLLPAQRDLDEIERQLHTLHAEKEQLVERLRRHSDLIEAIDAGDPDVLAHLAATELNLMPANHETAIVSRMAGRTISDRLDRTVAPLVEPEPLPPPSLLERLVEGPVRLWVIGAAMICIFLGLIIGPAEVGVAEEDDESGGTVVRTHEDTDTHEDTNAVAHVNPVVESRSDFAVSFDDIDDDDNDDGWGDGDEHASVEEKRTVVAVQAAPTLDVIVDVPAVVDDHAVVPAPCAVPEEIVAVEEPAHPIVEPKPTGEIASVSVAAVVPETVSVVESAALIAVEAAAEPDPVANVTSPVLEPTLEPTLQEAIAEVEVEVAANNVEIEVVDDMVDIDITPKIEASVHASVQGGPDAEATPALQMSFDWDAITVVDVETQEDTQERADEVALDADEFDAVEVPDGVPDEAADEAADTIAETEESETGGLTVEDEIEVAEEGHTAGSAGAEHALEDAVVASDDDAEMVDADDAPEDASAGDDAVEEDAVVDEDVLDSVDEEGAVEDEVADDAPEDEYEDEDENEYEDDAVEDEEDGAPEDEYEDDEEEDEEDGAPEDEYEDDEEEDDGEYEVVDEDDDAEDEPEEGEDDEECEYVYVDEDGNEIPADELDGYEFDGEDASEDEAEDEAVAAKTDGSSAS